MIRPKLVRCHAELLTTIAVTGVAHTNGSSMSETRSDHAAPVTPPEPKPEDDPGMHKVDEAAQEEAAEERKDIGGYQ